MKRWDSPDEGSRAKRRMTQTPASDEDDDITEDDVVAWIRENNVVVFSAPFWTTLMANEFWVATRVWLEQLHRANPSQFKETIDQRGLLGAVCQSAPLEFDLIEFLLDCGADTTVLHDHNGAQSKVGVLFVHRLLELEAIVPNEQMIRLIDRLETNNRLPIFMRLRGINISLHRVSLHTYFFTHIIHRGLRDNGNFSDDAWCNVLNQCRDVSIFQATYVQTDVASGQTRRVSLPYALATFGCWRAFDQYIIRAKSFGSGVVDLHDILYFAPNFAPYVQTVFRTLDFNRIETVLIEVRSGTRNSAIFIGFINGMIGSVLDLFSLQERNVRIRSLAGRTMHVIRSLTPTLQQAFRGDILWNATHVPSLFCLLVARIKELAHTEQEVGTYWNVHHLAKVCHNIHRYQQLGDDGRVLMRDQIDLFIWCVANGLDPTEPLNEHAASCAEYAVDMNNPAFITRVIVEYPECFQQMIARARETRNPLIYAILQTEGMDDASDLEDDEEYVIDVERTKEEIRRFVQTQTRGTVFDAYQNKHSNFLLLYVKVMRELFPEIPWY